MLLPSVFLLLLPLSFAAFTPPPQTFINTLIARTIELGGATTQVTTQYNVKSSVDGPGNYYLTLAGDRDEEPAWWEVTVGGKAVEGVEIVPPTVSVPVGELKKGESVTLSLTYLFTHASTPLPTSIEQRDPQYLLWKTNSTYVDSWYASDVQRIKIRSPSPTILSYSSVPTTYTRDSTVTKSSSTLTLGPFHSIPATLGETAIEQKPFSVHYETREPVIGLRSLKRSAEVSHWGANLNIQDDIALVNIGPMLKGHFSRLAHQQSKFHASTPAQILTEFTLRVPPTAHSAYFYDTIGNVSTSHFRQGSTPASSARSSKVRTSPRTVDGVLELKPRYPVLGGWSYSFVVGYDMPLEDALKVESDGRKVLAVPFFTGMKDLVVDEVELRIVLPEGAKDVEVIPPFAVDTLQHSVHKTYLDSTGRHTITLRKTRCTENHAQPVYILYTYPLSAQLQKPLTVAAVVGGLFVLAMGLRRVDYGIEKTQ
ncbi:MAG: dolichyl-diphosphooligosaccharide--protein glycosyltransferase subunit 1 [Tremellales sp. Tagirdzhanova-0007]|nr:MAG: dolichyl-diphosphooligosaccharide--protein glycosyltransferase subunit 1 [Tremellales sp. Tagirdzhanova-0007]